MIRDRKLGIVDASKMTKLFNFGMYKKNHFVHQPFIWHRESVKWIYIYTFLVPSDIESNVSTRRVV